MVDVSRSVRRGLSLIGLAGHLLRARFQQTSRRRILLSICGVALAVAIVVVVAGISVGLTTQGTAVNSNVDYWIVPEGGDTSTLPVSASGPQFGDVHTVGDRLTADPRIEYASPVTISLLELTHSNTTEYVIVAGVVAYPGLEIAGVNTSALTAGDPYYANGTYSGTQTGDAVISDAAAELLTVSQGETVRVAAGRATTQFTIRDITDGSQTGAGSAPIAVVHLSELQTLVGGTSHDTADQFLVATDHISVRETLTTTYPNSNVITRSGSSLAGITDSQLALAIGVAGLLIAIVLGTLFVGTAMGLEITTDRRLWATLLALGFSQTSRSLLVAAQTVGTTIAGGVLGIGLGWLAIRITNAIVMRYLPLETLAVFDPVFAVYALGVGAFIGVLSVPYLLWLTARGEPTDHLTT